MREKTMLVTKCMNRLRDGSSLPSFRMIPVSNECPYLICEWDTSNNHLVVLSKEKKGELQAIPSITETGEFKKNKNGGQVVERRQMDEYFELNLTDTEGIQTFIEHMAINSDKKEIYLPFIAQIIPVKATVKGEMESPKLILQP